MSNFEPSDESSLGMLGGRLRQLREDQGLTYDDVAAATHVRPNILSAIEEGRILSVIDAPVYARGFVKTYCEYLYAQDIWTKYSAMLPTASESYSEGDEQDRVDVAMPRPVFKRTSIIWVYVVLVVAVAGAAFLLWSQHRSSSDDGDNGFFLKTEQPSDRLRPQPDPEPGPETADPGPELPASVLSADAASSDDQQPIPSADSGMVAPASSAEPKSVDLSWLDGTELSPASRDIVVPQQQYPDQLLMIEITKPLRLTVQQNGEILTRRNMPIGGARSYDVKLPTPVTLSVGSGADIIWYGKRYDEVGADNGPLELIFDPDGSVAVTSGRSKHFGASENTD